MTKFIIGKGRKFSRLGTYTKCYFCSREKEIKKMHSMIKEGTNNHFIYVCEVCYFRHSEKPIRINADTVKTKDIISFHYTRSKKHNAIVLLENNAILELPREEIFRLKKVFPKPFFNLEAVKHFKDLKKFKEIK